MLITQLVYRIGFRGTSTRIAQPPQKDDEALTALVSSIFELTNGKVVA
ncbi:MAG TPA: hypothetical protein VNX70_19360 [Bryobacteraceae bacterium]|nr:hypothetical protein [Bryobacteraceae bacterium]